MRTPAEMPGTSSSAMSSETRLVVEPTAVPSDTKMDDLTLATQNTSEPTLAPETDETHDKEFPDMETDDPDTMASVPEPSLVLQSASCLKRMSCSCPVRCRVFESKSRNMSANTESKGLELALSWRIHWM